VTVSYDTTRAQAAPPRGFERAVPVGTARVQTGRGVAYIVTLINELAN